MTTDLPAENLEVLNMEVFNTAILTWRIRTVMELWAPTGGVASRSSPLVHASSLLGSTNSGPVLTGNRPHAEPGTAAQDTRFL